MPIQLQQGRGHGEADKGASILRLHDELADKADKFLPLIPQHAQQIPVLIIHYLQHLVLGNIAMADEQHILAQTLIVTGQQLTVLTS